MDNKKLNELLDYLPAITREHDRYGWLGGKGLPISPESVSGVRTFFELLKEEISIENIPEPSEVFGNTIGGITVLWETDIVDDSLKYDSFYIEVVNDSFLYFYGELDSLETYTKGTAELNSELDTKIIEHMAFFKRKLNE